MATDPPRYGLESVKAITASTVIPVGVGIGALVLAVQITWNVSQAVSEFRYEIKVELTALRRDFTDMKKDRWTATDQTIWAGELAQENAGKLKIPKPVMRE